MTYSIKFKGIDDFNRPVYKVNDLDFYIGSVITLFPWDSPKNQVDNYFKDHLSELEYFGEKFNCEPTGGKLKTNITLIIEDLNEN